MRFCTFASQSRWNETSLRAVFRERFYPALQAELSCQDSVTSLSECITMAIKLDNLMCQQCLSGANQPPTKFREEFNTTQEEGSKPMQLEHTFASPEECQHDHSNCAFTVESRVSFVASVPRNPCPWIIRWAGYLVIPVLLCLLNCNIIMNSIVLYP